jgi:hypothetical protein
LFSKHLKVSVTYVERIMSSSSSSNSKRLSDINEQPDSKASRINELDARIAITSSRLEELLKTEAVDKDLIQLIYGKEVEII